ncbi:hypothetical protein SEUCBS140593_010387 [Sporothrix eucalyptigena]|uniref:Major facilitator superfamily (MFS) profile domain-containing protein n=1 Tax=Sporothrix eucalyptigena TaxID=1812306 RepID=A0ABP0D4F2_9PEZI
MSAKVEHSEDASKDASKDLATVILAEKDEEHAGPTAVDLLKGAEAATDREHTMGLWDAVRRHPKAVFWSVLFSLALVQEGFDHAFNSGFFSFPEFQKRYGVEVKPGVYEIPAEMQAGILNGVNAGEIVALVGGGYLADRFGYRWLMIGCMVMMTSFIFMQFFASDIYVLLGAEILLGIPWGVFQTLTTTYAAEVVPNILRPYLTMLVSFCWSLGFLLGTSVLRGCLRLTGPWAYRLPFALQWVFPVPLGIAIYFAPESPWWFVRKGRADDAAQSLRRLQSHASDAEVANMVAMMAYTVEIEDEMASKSTYRELLRSFDLRRTEITVMVYLIQELCAPLTQYAVYFLEEAGLDPALSFDFGMAQYAPAIVGVILAMHLVPKVGRRTLLLSGTAFATGVTFLIGFLGIPDPVTHTNIAYGVGSLLLIQNFVFFFTIGPIVYTIVTEIPSNALRTKSVAVARIAYNLCSLVYGQLTPHMVQTTSWNWGAKSGFFFGGIMLLGLVWAYFRVPETKGRTFAEVDILFKNHVAARDFAKTSVDLASQTVSHD